MVHIIDVREGDRLQRCVRCGRVLDVNQLPSSVFGAGDLMAIRHGQDRTEWRHISDRDELGPDEVACEQVLPDPD